MTPQEILEKVTPSQLDSYRRIVSRYAMEPESVSMWDGTLFANFGFILIGIEPDGYAHS